MEKSRQPDFNASTVYVPPCVEAFAVHADTGVCTSTATGTETFEEGENYLLF